MVALAEGEDRVFERAGAVEAQAVLGDGLARSSSRAPMGARASRMPSQCFLKACSSSPTAHNGFACALIGVCMMIWPVSPWRKALREERFLPSGVRGPVESCAFSRQAVSWASVVGSPLIPGLTGGAD